MRLTALEQARIQLLKVGVHFLERGAQPLAPFAVEVANRTAKARHRFGQLGLL